MKIEILGAIPGLNKSSTPDPFSACVNRLPVAGCKLSVASCQLPVASGITR
jgi:hypothetical protein